jgi:septal ring factor EnvC (AmiA/AmiB activator)
MPKQPEDLVIRILRDIQGTLAEHTKMHADHTRRFEQIEQRLDDVNEGMVTALGLASHAHVRDETMRKDITDLKKRVKRLEAKR